MSDTAGKYEVTEAPKAELLEMSAALWAERMALQVELAGRLNAVAREGEAYRATNSATMQELGARIAALDGKRDVIKERISEIQGRQANTGAAEAAAMALEAFFARRKP